MGMFDTVRVEMPLPGVGIFGGEFQTKDLDCALDHYRITASGRLERRDRKFEMCESVSERWEPHVHHGFLTFRNSHDAVYTAKFSYGKVVGIRAGEPDSWLPGDGAIDPWQVLAHIAEGLKKIDHPSDETERLRAYAEAALRTVVQDGEGDEFR